MKKMKFSLGMKIASLLSCVALVSMGFASWWIVKLPDEVTRSGSFTVYSVENKEIQFTNSSNTQPAITNGVIQFGKPNPAYDSETATAKWLIADGTMGTDALVATLTFPVSVKGDTTTTLDSLISTINVEFTPGDDIKSALDTAISKGYLAAPVLTWSYTNSDGTVTGTSNSSTDLDYDGSKANNILSIDAPAANSITVTITITFDWGTETGGVNPFIYYNKLDYIGNETADTTDDNNVKAYNLLDAVFGLNKPADAAAGTNYGYDLTLSATVKS